MEMPEKPENKWESNEIAVLLGGIACIILGFQFFEMMFLFFVFAGMGVFLCFQALSQKNDIYNKKIREYELAMKNFEESKDKDTLERKNLDGLQQSPNVHYRKNSSIISKESTIGTGRIEYSNTGFHDSLKMNTRTSDEYSNELRRAANAKVEKEAKDTFERIKTDLLILANQGKYEIAQDGRKILLSVTWCEPRYLNKYEIDRLKLVLEEETRMVIGKSKKEARRIINANQDRRTTAANTPYSVTFSVSHDFKLYFDKLKELANKEEISIRYGLLEESTNKIYDLPITFNDYIRQWDHSLIVECSCIIPENYSNDKPIMIIPKEQEKPEDSLDIVNIDSMDGHDFEEYCASILIKNGFEDVTVTSGSGDQGIDIIAYKDEIKYGIQCKCYSSDVGNKAVQEAYAGMKYYDCHVGVVLTNRYFTKAARELAKHNGIILWNRDKLIKLISQAQR